MGKIIVIFGWLAGMISGVFYTSAQTAGKLQDDPKQDATATILADTPVTLDLMIGQMIMLGIGGTSADENPDMMRALEGGKVGGIILFEKNLSIDSTAIRLSCLTGDLQKSSRFPLLIAIDQEGGRVNRLKTKYGFPESRTASWIGEINNSDTSVFYAAQTASTLASLGINLNFAPVVDLCANPTNPVIASKERCFSSDPESVTQQAILFIDAHHQHQVLTTLKHFPGHGSSTGDTHLEMTEVTGLWSTDELIPYQELIRQNKVDGIMTAHIVHCGLDTSCLPATLSKPIISGLLRDSLGYNGVVFTDDMHMKAIAKYYGLEKGILLAINAGVDILLFSNNIPGVSENEVEAAHHIIKNLVVSGEITEERIRESWERIISMKAILYPRELFIR